MSILVTMSAVVRADPHLFCAFKMSICSASCCICVRDTVAAVAARSTNPPPILVLLAGRYPEVLICVLPVDSTFDVSVDSMAVDRTLDLSVDRGSALSMCRVNDVMSCRTSVIKSADECRIMSTLNTFTACFSK